MIELLETFLSIYGWYILLGLGFIIFLYFIAPYGWAVYLMQRKLKDVRSFLIEKLGPKSGQIIDVWIEGLDVVKDGNLSEEEMVQEFIKIIKLRAASADLQQDDNQIVEDAARMTIQSLAGNTKNQAAFKILSKK
jgi:hypothetical protein